MSTARTATSGAAFGAALALAGVASPSCIVDQLRLRDSHMVSVFLTAVAGSSLVILYGPSQTSAATSATSAATANVLGGAMQGVGMALAGACAGTVWVQLGCGVASAPPTLVGAALGGVVWARFGAQAKRLVASTPAETPAEPSAPTVIAFAALCLAAAATAPRLIPGPAPWSAAAAGGAAIAAAQAVSLGLTGSTLGTSAAYEQLGRLFWRATGSRDQVVAGPLVFAAAIAAGSAALNFAAGPLWPAETVVVPASRALVGGFLIALGARLAGGCTSGHGISGLSRLRPASFATVAAMFGGGIVTATMLA